MEGLQGPYHILNVGLKIFQSKGHSLNRQKHPKPTVTIMNLYHASAGHAHKTPQKTDIVMMQEFAAEYWSAGFSKI